MFWDIYWTVSAYIGIATQVLFAFGLVLYVILEGYSRYLGRPW